MQEETETVEVRSVRLDKAENLDMVSPFSGRTSPIAQADTFSNNNAENIDFFNYQYPPDEYQQVYEQRQDEESQLLDEFQLNNQVFEHQIDNYQYPLAEQNMRGEIELKIEAEVKRQQQQTAFFALCRKNNKIFKEKFDLAVNQDPMAHPDEKISLYIDANVLFEKFMDSTLQDRDMEDFVELQYLKALEVRRRQAFVNASSAKKAQFEQKMIHKV